MLVPLWRRLRRHIVMVGVGSVCHVDPHLVRMRWSRPQAGGSRNDARHKNHAAWRKGRLPASSREPFRESGCMTYTSAGSFSVCRSPCYSTAFGLGYPCRRPVSIPSSRTMLTLASCRGTEVCQVYVYIIL